MEILIDSIQRRKIRRDFKNFLYVAFHYLNLPDPTPIQYDIADVLQYELDDVIIEGFRGVAKSTITGCYTDWKLDNDPENYQVLGISANMTEAMKILKFSRSLFDIIPFLEYLKPDKDKGQRDSALQFDVAPAIPRIQPSYKCYGILGNLTGNRAVEIVADDIETSINCETEIKRQAVEKAVSEFSPILRPLKGRAIFLGTPHTEDSIYNKLNLKGTKLQIFPVKYPDNKEILKYNGNLSQKMQEQLIEKPELVGTPTDPLRFDSDTIIKEEAKGRSKFLMQYMLDNTLSDMEKYPLKLGDFSVMDLDKEIAPEKVAYGSSNNLIIKDLPAEGIGSDKFFYSPIPLPDVKWLPYTYKVLAIDPSGRGKDELAFTVLGVLNSQIFILKLKGIQGGYSEENLQLFANIAKEFKINKIKIESNFGDGMFTALLTPYIVKNYPCSIEEVRHNTQKEKRIINSLEPVLNSHKLIISKDVIKEDLKDVEAYPYEVRRQYSFQYQLTRLTNARNALTHDDKIDVLAMGVQDCLDMLSLDVDNEVQLRKEEEFLADLAATWGFDTSCGGNWLKL